ncbi:MAG: hypothetical protein HND52_01810 [Ignavibacteriae bacterium]|jgi:hypothetical protein|nr:hypothetical protein [Ignavibacteriota bacterium]NOG96686.1 hypothetical protein [Ignavibacteriota bacterium]
MIINTYKYSGAYSLILLHEKHLKLFLDKWTEAKKINLALPETTDQDYESLETLLRHVLRSARGYMVWMCEKLELPDPEIDDPPSLENIEQQASSYIDHLVEKWKTPLSDVEEVKFSNKVYNSNWGVPFCIDAMLEHAVMHPIRHAFQLENLIKDNRR